MKTCTACKEVKSLDEFHRRAAAVDGLQYVCKSCNTAQRREYYKSRTEYEIAENTRRSLAAKAKLRREVWKYLETHPCVDCGYDNPLVLEFDHVRGQKIGNVSELITSGRPKRVWEEIKKCEVRCANCHRLRTVRQLGWHSALLQLPPLGGGNADLPST